ncbi:MAG: vitamin K epoxide reductase family protein [Thermoplasmata archaeon]
MRTRNLRSLVYFAGGLGLLVAVFAAAEFFDAALRSVCSVNSFFSCSLIDESAYTNTLGVPDYLWGIGGFVLILVAAALAEQRPKDPTRAYFLLGITTVGVVLSLYLLYIELGVIHGLCPVCAVDYLLCGVAWVGSIALVRRLPAKAPPDEDEEAPETDAESPEIGSA